MLRKEYFDYIESKLSVLVYSIKARSKLNLLELNIHAETFYAHLFNIIFDYNLENINSVEQNAKAIDLIDRDNKTIIQVSSTKALGKLRSSLNNANIKEYSGYHYKFIPICIDAKNLRTPSFDTKFVFSFNSEQDIYDITTILRLIESFSIEKLKNTYAFIRDELGEPPSPIKINSNLAEILNILSKSDLSLTTMLDEPVEFNIQKKIQFNQLQNKAYILNEYKIYYKNLNTIYSEFDKLGTNKTLSILQAIRSLYFSLPKEETTPALLFDMIFYKIIDLITGSKNYNEIPIEELEMCIHIIMVDAFIKCKIYEPPEE